MLVFKKACESFNEDFGSYVAEFVYKKFRGGDVTEKDAAEEFCAPHEVCSGIKKDAVGRNKKTAKGNKKRATQSADPYANLPPEFNNLMQEMRDDPLSFSSPEEKREIVSASESVACSVCRKLVEHLPRYNDEVHYDQALETICDGGENEMFQTKLPRWLDKFDVVKDENARWVIQSRRGKRDETADFRRVQTLLRTCKKVARLDELTERLYSRQDPCIEVCPGSDEL